MKKSEILAILGSSVTSYRVFEGRYTKDRWLEVKVDSIDYGELKNILKSLLRIEPINENEILLVFENETIID